MSDKYSSWRLDVIRPFLYHPFFIPHFLLYVSDFFHVALPFLMSDHPCHFSLDIAFLPVFFTLNVLLRRFYLVLSLHTFSFYFIYIIFLCFFLSSAFPDTISLFIIYVGVTLFYGSTFLFLSEIRLFLYNIHRAVDILFRCWSFNFFFLFDVSTLLQYNLLTCL